MALSVSDFIACPGAPGGVHITRRARDGRRCLNCDAWVHPRNPRQIGWNERMGEPEQPFDVEAFWRDIGRPVDPEPDVDEDLIRLGSDFQ